MRLTLVTPPAAGETILPLADAKVHLRVTEAASDAEITAAIQSAVQTLDGRDGRLGRALCTQTWSLELDAFPSGDSIEIPLPPLRSVSAITYIDADGVEQTMPAADYLVDVSSVPGVVALAYGASWPTARDQRNAVKITFVAGYGDGAAVPKPIQSALKLMVGDLFANREDGTSAGSNSTVERLLWPYRIIRP